MNSGKAFSPAVRVYKVSVLPDRIEAHVRVRDEACRMVSSGLVDACVRAFPELPSHQCKNDRGTHFGDVMFDTSVPHLLEHLVITLQVRHDAQAGAGDFPYVGTTQWVAKHGSAANHALEALVSLRFRNDVVALGCLKQAVEFLNGHMA